KNTQLAIAL
ncbi:hypothetical protein D030_1377B, partial [Vibrio parahaemolyticus AQ3810]